MGKNAKTLANNVKQLRLANHLTQEELAQKVGYSHKGNIAQIESGNANIPIAKLYVMCEVLGVTPSQIMGYYEKDIEETARLNRYKSYVDRLKNLTLEEIDNVNKYIDFLLSQR